MKQLKSMTRDHMPFFILIIGLPMILGVAKKRLWWSSAFLVLLLMAIAVAGRPAVFRATFPPFVLLAVFAVLGIVYSKREQMLRNVGLLLVSLLILGHLGTVYVEHNKRTERAKQARERYNVLTANSFISWGAVFPFEYIYPVLGRPDQSLSQKAIYAWGWPSYLPNTNTYRDQISGTTFAEQFTSGAGVTIMLTPQLQELLSVYCQEHFNGVTEEHLRGKYGKNVTLVSMQCVRNLE